MLLHKSGFISKQGLTFLKLGLGLAKNFSALTEILQSPSSQSPKVANPE